MRLLKNSRNYHYCSSIFLCSDYNENTYKRSTLHRGSFEEEIFEKRVFLDYCDEINYVSVFDDLVCAGALEFSMYSIKTLWWEYDT